MKWVSHIVVPVVAMLITHIAYADIQTDGSVGAATTISGPEYNIEASLGTQSGGNLFHSFSEFSVGRGETATFAGPSSVDNIISRVSGNSISEIDGTLKSTIPGADLYLINPNGVVFGKDAQLDVLGSFNASTADVLRFSDGSTFSSSGSMSDLLTIAPIQSFGFLDSTPAHIEVNSESLSVPEGKDFNLIGGNIAISIEEVGKDGINAHNGNVNLISSAGESDVLLVNGSPSLDSQIGGSIDLSGYSRVRTSTSTTNNAGNISMQAQTISLSDHSKVSSDTFAVGNAGNISILSNSFYMLDNASLSTSTFNLGDAGNIALDVASAQLSGDTFINSTAYISSGNAGDITVNARESLRLEENGTIKSTANNNTTGDGGNIEINTSELFMVGLGETDGDGDPSEDSALISSSVLADTQGLGGDITINAGFVDLSDGATIAVHSGGSGNAGSIDITASQNLAANTGFITSAASTASGGNITLRGSSIIDLQNSQVSASVGGGAGDGGNVYIFDVGALALEDSHISANSEGSSGGLLYLDTTLVRNPYSSTTALGADITLDGEVFVASEINPNDLLNELLLGFFDNEIKDPCSVVIAENESYLNYKNAVCE